MRSKNMPLSDAPHFAGLPTSSTTLRKKASKAESVVTKMKKQIKEKGESVVTKMRA